MSDKKIIIRRRKKGMNTYPKASDFPKIERIQMSRATKRRLLDSIIPKKDLDRIREIENKYRAEGYESIFLSTTLHMDGEWCRLKHAPLLILMQADPMSQKQAQILRDRK